MWGKSSLRLLEKYDEAAKRVQTLRNQIDNNAKSLQELADIQSAYSPSIFSDQLFNEHTSALYDPEQTITRIVNYYVQKSLADETQITMNDQRFEKDQIKFFVLNLHSRTDMCPFCCMFLAHHLQEWRSKIKVPFLAVVMSRQEYRCNYKFMKQQPYYRGYTMRSFGWYLSDRGKSIEGIFTYS